MRIFRRPKLARLFMPPPALTALLAAAIIASACGSDAATQSTAEPAAPASTSAASVSDTPGKADSTASAPSFAQTRIQPGLSGEIEIDGSSTVAPVTEAVAEEFRKVAPDVQVNVGISGSGGGFKRFVAGETDISDASRVIRDSEAQTAEENGVGYHEFLVGVDGLSVLVNPQNDFVECLTIDQLNAIWRPESEVDSWDDVDPSWPDRPMRLYGPGTDSGTFDYFTEEVMGEAKLSRPDYTASEDDNVLVQGISGDRNALGYFGFAYYQENADKLKLVSVDSGGGCVAPSLETIASGEYSPLSRPLFIYVSKASLERAEVRSFVEFYMENGSALTAEVGYVPLSDADYFANLLVAQGVAAPPAPAVDTASLRGEIEIDGSSTVAPVTEAVAEEFRKVAPDVQVNVGISGSGGGFKRFVAGETDISDASRVIRDSEAQTAAENGIGYHEFLVGVDGLSVLVNPQNDFVECLTIDQLNAIWRPESAVDSWDDVDPSWPDRPMRLYGPGTDSGTFDYFTEEVMGEAKLSRPDYTASEDDNVLVQGVSGDRNALGYFGFAYYQENADKLKLVSVDSGGGCVAPSLETIASGEYSPLSRPLFIYVSQASLERPEVRSFVEFYMENGSALTAEVGYVPLEAMRYQQNLAALRQK